MDSQAKTRPGQGEPSAEQMERARSGSTGDDLPRNFGRLTLLRRLARGGMGEVYLAATRGIEGAERPVVVKTIRGEHEKDKSFRARFLDETRIMAQLQHPGVVQILEASTTEDDMPYAVVEYVEGRHMGEVLARSTQLGVRIDWADALAISIGFAEALHHVHTRTDASGRPLEIAHRDLSPQNVMIGYAGDVKLIDFGTARGENRRCRTVSGVVYAKPGYVAPEVAQQIPGGPAADLYAFGVMVWELAAGRRFLQGDPVEHQARVARGDAPLPEIAARLGAPFALDRLLARLTEFDPELRLADAGKVVRELGDLLKLAPSLADGDRSIRGRIAHLMGRLYPAEPARSRADFARRLTQARDTTAPSARPGIPEPSPLPGAAQAEALLSGTRYRLLRKISSSAMSEVWEATHVDLGRTVALKLTPEGAAPSGGARARFRAEARALARLEHPGLVKIHDFGFTTDGRSFFSMDMLEGETLEERIAREPLSVHESVRVCLAALEALGVAHQAGLVHRDITPSNLFLTRAGELKLIDFGVSLSVEQNSECEEGEGPAVVGTPEYISPEQAAGAEADLRSDIYSLGVVFYECLTGRLPHPLGPEGSTTLAALLTAKITVTPEAPSQVRGSADIKKPLDKVVLMALHRDAAKRFASTVDFARALRAAASSRGFALPLFKSTRSLARSRTGISGSQLPRVLPTAGKMKILPTTGQMKTWGGLTVALAAMLVLLLLRPSGEAGASSRMPEEPPVLDLDALVVPPEPALASAPTPSTDGEAPPIAAPPAEAQARGGPVSLSHSELDVARTLLKSGKTIAAHHHARELADSHPKDVEVMRTLVETARAVRAWGEALEAASRVVALEPSADGYYELARLERATLNGDPIVSLQKALMLDKSHERARALLSRYERDDRLARR